MKKIRYDCPFHCILHQFKLSSYRKYHSQWFLLGNTSDVGCFHSSSVYSMWQTVSVYIRQLIAYLALDDVTSKQTMYCIHGCICGVRFGLIMNSNMKPMNLIRVNTCCCCSYIVMYFSVWKV